MSLRYFGIFAVLLTRVGLLAGQADSGAGDRALFLLNAIAGNRLIFGSPATLYRLGAGGDLQLAATIAKGGDRDGVDFVLADYDRRIVAVATPKALASTVSLLSMDDPSVVRRKALNTRSDDSPIWACLLQRGSDRLAVALRYFNNSRDEYIATPIGSDGSHEALADGEEVHCRPSGYFGTVSDRSFGIPVRLEAGGRILVNHSKDKTELAVKAPPQMHADLFGNIEVSTDEVMVMATSKPIYSVTGLGTSVQHVYAVSSKSWNSLTLPGSSTTVRAFGKWLAFVVSEAQPWAVPNGSGQLVFDPDAERLSPGQAGRVLNVLPSEPGGERVTMDNFFEDAMDWFPGILLCYNVETRQLFRIETGQGDSEVVLIDGSDVYYRVNTELYRARIGPSGIQEGVRLIQDPAVGNVHWAFFGGQPK